MYQALTVCQVCVKHLHTRTYMLCQVILKTPQGGRYYLLFVCRGLRNEENQRTVQGCADSAHRRNLSERGLSCVPSVGKERGQQFLMVFRQQLETSCLPYLEAMGHGPVGERKWSTEHVPPLWSS